MTERRQYFRRRTLLDGRLEVAKLNGWSLDCTVRNLSEAGARLALPTDIVVPQKVNLAVSDGPQRPAMLVWYREGKAGFSLGERRAAARPAAANDSSAARPEGGPVGLSARIAAIAAKGQAEPRFTRS